MSTLVRTEERRGPPPSLSRMWADLKKTKKGLILLNGFVKVQKTKTEGASTMPKSGPEREKKKIVVKLWGGKKSIRRGLIKGGHPAAGHILGQKKCKRRKRCIRPLRKEAT